MRKLIKGIARVAAWIVVCVPAFAVRWLEPIDRHHKVFQFGSQSLSLIPGKLGVYLRHEFYRIALHLEASDFEIEFGTIFAMRGSTIGRGVYIGSFCTIGFAAIGDDTLIGSNVDVIGGGRVHHFDRLDVPIRHQGGQVEIVRIGRDAWVGNSAVVMADVGDGAVVGAGSVVVKPCKPYGVYVGNPARLVRERGSVAGNDLSTAASNDADLAPTGG